MKKEMIGSVPGNVLGMLADLNHKLQHGVISPDQLSRFLKKLDPFFIPNIQKCIESQTEFYSTILGYKVDFSRVRIPERRPDFDRLIIIPQGMTAQRAVELCRLEFDCGILHGYNLDEFVTIHDRDSRNGDYAIWVRDSFKEDESMMHKSANDIRLYDIQTETLTERLLHELIVFKECGRHLVDQFDSLCSGTRFTDFSVPALEKMHTGIFIRNYQAHTNNGSAVAREVCA